MNKIKYLPLILFAITLFACTHLGPKSEHGEVEIAEFMAPLQRFSEKLYFAGKQSNWELAKFYLHELEEVAEELEEANAFEDGINVSKLVAPFLLNPIEKMEKSVKSENNGEFLENYSTMVTSCNQCHTATHHGFIKIIIPTNSSFPNQSFKK